MNSNSEISPTQTNIAIGLVSAAIIAFQLALMQILSYIQWHHFAYLIISLALLGFGAAGTFLTLFQKVFVKNYYILFSLLAISTAILMPGATILANSPSIRFDSLLIFHDSRHIVRLATNCIIYFLPFFTGALAIGLTFVKFADQIEKIYFSNLIGSGIGGAIAIGLLHFAIPSHQPVYIALIALAGGLISFPRHAGKLFRAAIIGSIIILAALFFIPPGLKPSEYKDISKTLLLPQAKIEYEKNSPDGIVQIVSSPVLRFAPGVSLCYQDSYPVRKAVFNNGNWAGCLVPAYFPEQMSILDFTPQSLPYHIAKIDKALILEAGTGENISLALSHHVPVIVANEANKGIFSLTQNSFKNQKNVELNQTISRTLLATGGSGYDLIELPVIGSFFGNSGLNAIETRYELSIEALNKMWNGLSANGMISLSCWLDYPVRNAYRLLSSIELLLEQKNIPPGNMHILAIRSWSSVTFLVKKSAFNPEQVIRTHKFCERLMFDMLIEPGITNINHGRYNLFQDTLFFSNTEQLLSSARYAFITEYPYRIQPTTDNQPFFFQQIRWRGIGQTISAIEGNTVPFLELGYLLAILTFILLVIIAALLIILPLGFTRWKSKSKLWILIYFSGIGLAYMFVEIVFIQLFTFYFGQITYAAAITISLLLISSGFGSYYSSKLLNYRKLLFLSPVIVAAILFLYSLFLSPFLSATTGLPPPVKYLISFTLLAIPGFILGIPFPLGIKQLATGQQSDIAWSWAINGYFSVIGTTVATIIAVEAGYNWLIVSAAVAYMLAGLAIYRIKILKE